MASSFIRHLARPVLTSSKGRIESKRESHYLCVDNLGFLSAATHRNLPSSLVLLHRTQATTPPTTTPNVPARKFDFFSRREFLE
jgi:hypothetical protein